MIWYFREDWSGDLPCLAYRTNGCGCCSEDVRLDETTALPALEQAVQEAEKELESRKKLRDTYKKHGLARTLELLK